MGKIRAVTVGLGIGMAHAAGYLDSPHAELYGVCDLIPERLATVGGTFAAGSMMCIKPLYGAQLLGRSWESIGVKTFSSLEDVLADPLVDMVSLCTPDYQHADQAHRVAASGRHLLLEKPVDIDLAKARDLQRYVSELPISVAIGYEFRVNPAVLMVKELVDSGELGVVKGFSLHHFRTPFRRDKWHTWIQRRSLSGGLIIEETCHWFDLARYVTGLEPYTVNAVTAGGINPGFDFEDIAYISGTYEGGGVYQIAHTLTGFDFSLVIQVHGTRKTAWCGLKEEQYSALDAGSSAYLGIVACGVSGQDSRDAVVKTWQEEALEPWNIRELTMQNVERVVRHEAPLCDVNEGVAALELSHLALLSAERGGDTMRRGDV